jgi:threonine/homoserine/homoserine lactone efflux protein
VLVVGFAAGQSNTFFNSTVYLYFGNILFSHYSLLCTLYLLMDQFLLNFLTGAVISFLGSLPVGILNVTIVHITLQKGLQPAFYFAIACALVELGYSYIAVLLTQVVFNTSALTGWIHAFSILVFMGAGIHYFRKKTTPSKVRNVTGAFYKGILLSVINVIAIPFWLVYTSLLLSHQWIQLDSGIETGYFIAGIALGTALSLLSFAVFSHRINQRFVLESVKVNRVLGLLLMATSVLEALYLIN